MPTPTTERQWRRAASTAKRLIVVTVGFAICGAGLIMLVLPGPGILVVFVGLLVLASEFSWAERALERTRTRAVDATSRLHASRVARAGVALSATSMIIGGAGVAAVVDGHRFLGVSVLIAGIAALAILIPATKRLIDRPLRPSTSRVSPTAGAIDRHYNETSTS